MSNPNPNPNHVTSHLDAHRSPLTESILRPMNQPDIDPLHLGPPHPHFTRVDWPSPRPNATSFVNNSQTAICHVRCVPKLAQCHLWGGEGSNADKSMPDPT